MKHLPIEQDIEQPNIEYGADGIPKSHMGRECKISVNLFGVASWWRRRREKKHEEQGYGWAYECGCSAPAGACSDPYCPVHGLKLMRYKRRE